MSERYYVVKEKAVPEVLLKVLEAKRLMESNKRLTVQQATELSLIHISEPTRH